MLDGPSDLLNGKVVGLQFVGIHFYLVLLDKSSDARHLRYTGHRSKLVSEIPVLKASELLQIVVAGGVFENVLVHPADAGGVRTQARCYTGRKTAGDKVQVLEHP